MGQNQKKQGRIFILKTKDFLHAWLVSVWSQLKLVSTNLTSYQSLYSLVVAHLVLSDRGFKASWMFGIFFYSLWIQSCASLRRSDTTDLSSKVLSCTAWADTSSIHSELGKVKWLLLRWKYKVLSEKGWVFKFFTLLWFENCSLQFSFEKEKFDFFKEKDQIKQQFLPF